MDRWRTAFVALAAALALGLSACGGGGSKPSRSTARPASFPKLSGTTLTQVRQRYGRGPVLAQAVSDLQPGRSRLAFGLFDRSRRQVPRTTAAVYVARSLDSPIAGPYQATYESLAVKPPYESKTVANDPQAAHSVYVSRVPFEAPGNYGVFGLVRVNDRLVVTDPVGVKVVRRSPVPAVGDSAPRISTPTAKSVHGRISEIETRVPPDDMHGIDYADVLGKRPIVIAFATPALCESRTCGPVVDIEEQVKHEDKGGAAFIHMEVYRDNDPSKGYRPQLRAFGLTTEPWIFGIDRKGRIAGRLEGPVGARELTALARAAEGK